MIDRFKSMRWCVAAAVLALALGGCSKKSDADHGRGTVSERQRDSTLAKSVIPGASAVGKALAASDSAAARAARIDSSTH